MAAVQIKEVKTQAVILELTEEEARALFRLTGVVSGSGHLRDVIDGVYEALSAVPGFEALYKTENPFTYCQIR